MATLLDTSTINDPQPRLRRPLVLMLLIAVAIVVALAVGAWFVTRDASDDGTSVTTGQTVQSDAAARTAAAESMQLVVGGTLQPLPATISLSSDLTTTVALTDGDAPYARTVDLFLFHEDDPTVGIAGATVRATAQMELMEHGSVQTEAVAGGDGHYRISLPLEMAGDWQIDVEIETPEVQTTVVFSLAVWD